MKSILQLISSIFILCIFIASCNTDEKDLTRKRYLDKTIKVDKYNFPLDSNQNYFPFEILKDTNSNPKLASFIVDWFSKHLYAMKEPLLFNELSEKETYRFLWLRTFHNPVSIRIERKGDEVQLFWRLCDGAGGYEPGKLVINKKIKLSLDQWDTFLVHLETINFWDKKAHTDDDAGLDGSEWILEGATQKRYHFIYRWSPKNNGKENNEYYKACMYLIDLTDLNIKEDLIY